MLRIRALAIGAAALVGWLAAPATAQEVTQGEWHYTTATSMSGMNMPNIPPEQLKKMPPNVRARIERMMHGRNMEYSACVTARKAKPQLPKNLDCKVEHMHRDGHRLTWSASCRMPNGMTSRADAAATYHRHRMVLDMTIRSTGPAGRPTTSHIHTVGRYVGPCK
ncbi:MAG: DUF3617 domain-containing protein [Stellaceae bacterium]